MKPPSSPPLISSQSSQAVTVGTLPSILRNMGIALSTSRPFRRFRNPVSFSASTHVASVEQDESHSPELDALNLLEETAILDIDTIRASDPIVVEAYNLLAKHQCPPLKGGYKFSKANHIVSHIGPPPSPCKMCKHWDKECATSSPCKLIS